MYIVNDQFESVLSRSGTVDWRQWWEDAKSEEWGALPACISVFWLCELLYISASYYPQSRQHPVQLWSDESKAKALAVALHGDEGTSKRSKSVLVVSISPLGIHRGDSLLQKYPFCVPWSH